jgi:hypothetical protein
VEKSLRKSSLQTAASATPVLLKAMWRRFREYTLYSRRFRNRTAANWRFDNESGTTETNSEVGGLHDVFLQNPVEIVDETFGVVATYLLMWPLSGQPLRYHYYRDKFGRKKSRAVTVSVALCRLPEGRRVATWTQLTGRVLRTGFDASRLCNRIFRVCKGQKKRLTPHLPRWLERWIEVVHSARQNC